MLSYCYWITTVLFFVWLCYLPDCVVGVFIHIRSSDRIVRSASSLSGVGIQRSYNSKAGVSVYSRSSSSMGSRLAYVNGSTNVPLTRSTVTVTNRRPQMSAPIPKTAPVSNTMGWEVLIVSNCHSLKLNSQMIIINYRGALYYQQHNAAAVQVQNEPTNMQKTGGDVTGGSSWSALNKPPHEEIEDSKYSSQIKKLQCVGQFENRCGRIDVSGEAFSVAVVGFEQQDAGIYRCISDDGATLAEYNVTFKENPNPPTLLNQPVLLFDIRPYTVKQPMIEQNAYAVLLATVSGGAFFVITVLISVCFFVDDPPTAKNNKLKQFRNSASPHCLSSPTSRASYSALLPSNPFQTNNNNNNNNAFAAGDHRNNNNNNYSSTRTAPPPTDPPSTRNNSAPVVVIYNSNCRDSEAESVAVPSVSIRHSSHHTLSHRHSSSSAINNKIGNDNCRNDNDKNVVIGNKSNGNNSTEKGCNFTKKTCATKPRKWPNKFVGKKRQFSISADNSPASEGNQAIGTTATHLGVPTTSHHHHHQRDHRLSSGGGVGVSGAYSAGATSMTSLCHLDSSQPGFETRSISQELRMFRLAVHLTKQQQIEIAKSQHHNEDGFHDDEFDDEQGKPLLGKQKTWHFC